MNLNNLHDSRVVSLPKQEQGLAWLIERGPLVADPPLPAWMLKALVSERRVLRLRRGLYLVPDESGRLLSLAATINTVDPDGYVTGHGALMLHGLNDQDISHWWSLTSRRQSDIRYGPFHVHFVVSPENAKAGRRATLTADGDQVRVATVTQAILDEVRFMPDGLDWVETARVLRNALEDRKTSEHQIVALLRARPSIAVARRLGLLLELVQSKTNPDLLAIARKNDDLTRLAGGIVSDKTWRLSLPLSRDRMLRAIQ